MLCVHFCISLPFSLMKSHWNRRRNHCFHFPRFFFLNVVRQVEQEQIWHNWQHNFCFLRCRDPPKTGESLPQIGPRDKSPIFDMVLDNHRWLMSTFNCLPSYKEPTLFPFDLEVFGYYFLRLSAWPHHGLHSRHFSDFVIQAKNAWMSFNRRGH